MLIVLALAVTFALVGAREEVHHIHSENGKNVHIHIHETGHCNETVTHEHHHDSHGSQVNNGDHGGRMHGDHMMRDESAALLGDVDHPGSDHADHHDGDGIHIHIHEAGEDCTDHAEHGEGGGHGMSACATCMRHMSHRGDDRKDDHRGHHPGHHGKHEHGEDAAKHDHSEDYEYAHCEVVPNSAVPKRKRSKVTGSVHMRQSIYGGPVEMQLRLRGFKTKGKVVQHMHGFHVHEFGDLSDGCQSTGSHFNPFDMTHGSPDDEIRHAGDYGNIHCDDKGVTNVNKNDTRSTLVGHHNIIGRALVIHEKEDDMGLGGTEASKKTGDAGGRLACCIIVRAKPHGDWASHAIDHNGAGDHMDHSAHSDHGRHGDQKKHGEHKKHGKSSKEDHGHHGHHGHM